MAAISADRHESPDETTWRGASGSSRQRGRMRASQRRASRAVAPPLVGCNARLARERALSAGLRAVCTSIARPHGADGECVIAQIPTGGTALRPGDVVALLVGSHSPQSSTDDETSWSGNASRAAAATLPVATRSSANRRPAWPRHSRLARPRPEVAGRRRLDNRRRAAVVAGLVFTVIVTVAAASMSISHPPGVVAAAHDVRGSRQAPARIVPHERQRPAPGASPHASLSATGTRRPHGARDRMAHREHVAAVARATHVQPPAVSVPKRATAAKPMPSATATPTVAPSATAPPPPGPEFF
jgi:hypothetical protein